MIMSRSPLRISLGGGGTDLPSYYREHTGFVLSAAINKYVYITVHDAFQREIIVKYSQLERVENIDDVKHPIVRESLKLVGIEKPALEIISIADIPAGTGLGSSGSFTTALLRALHAHEKHLIGAREIAEQACHVELDLLKEPIGKQDQYIAAFGGVTCFDFMPDGQVKVSPLNASRETLSVLEEDLLLFFTGFSRSASNILKDQDSRSKSADKSMLDNLHLTKDLGLKSKEALERGDLHTFAELMNIHWEHKRKRSSGMSNPKIDEWYELARRNGALGGKLIGAGGGGFLMFYAEEKARLRRAMSEAGLTEVRFSFDFEGTKVVNT